MVLPKRLVIIIPAVGEGPPRIARPGEDRMSDKRYRFRLFTAITSSGFIDADVYRARPETREDEIAIEQLVVHGHLHARTRDPREAGPGAGVSDATSSGGPSP